MTNPLSNPGEWVWITHDELGDSPNPVLRSALHHWIRQGWSETDPPREPSITAMDGLPAEGEPELDTTDATGLQLSATASGVREEKPRASRPARDAAASPAADTE